MQSVDIVDVFLPLVNFSLHPVAVEIAEQMIRKLGSSGVPLPFPNIVAKECLVYVMC